jgi:hypothetical protein
MGSVVSYLSVEVAMAGVLVTRRGGFSEALKHGQLNKASKTSSRDRASVSGCAYRRFDLYVGSITGGDRVPQSQDLRRYLGQLSRVERVRAAFGPGGDGG